MLNLFAQAFARRLYRNYEKTLLNLRVPFKIDFGYFPRGWIRGILWGDLTTVWRKSNIPASGVAGFTCGDKSNGHSSLWEPDSPNYLAWCGVYIYRPDRFEDFYKSGLGVTELAREIGYRDDISWSKLFGNGKANYEEVKIERIDPLAHLPYYTESYFSTVKCQTYLGNGSSTLKTKLVSLTLAHYYRYTSRVSVGENFFFPPKKLSKEHNYEDILRDLWVLFLPLKELNLVVVFYATSVRATDNSWNYTEALKDEFMQFFRGIRIYETT